MPIEAASDDANRQQSVSRYFYLLGDVISGIDAATRVNGDGVAPNGVLGPLPQGTDYGVGADGSIFIRGRAGQVGTTNTQQQPTAPQTLFGLPIGTLLLIGAAVWFLKR